MRDVSSAFLEIDSCAARCEAGIAGSLDVGDLAQAQFVAAGVMGAFRLWLADDDAASAEEFLTHTCRLANATLGHESLNDPSSVAAVGRGLDW